VVCQNRLHPREKSILLETDTERVTTHMEEEDHFTQTLLPALSHCCTWQPLTFSIGLSHSALSLSICSALLLSIYRQEWCHQLQLFFNKGGCQLQLFFNNGGCQPLTYWMSAHGWCNFSCSCCNSQWTVPSINGCCTLMATNPTITPFAIHVGQLSSCFFNTSLHLAALPSLPF